MAVLPDVWGQFYVLIWKGGTTDGCFQFLEPQYNGAAPAYGHEWGGTVADFRASRSSSVYGSSETVTPLSLSSIFIIRY